MASGDSAWAFQDPQTRQRRNREWIIGRSRVPLFDVDLNDALSVTPVSVSGAVLTTSNASLYTVPASGVTVAQIASITVTNFSGSARVVNIYLGASAVLANQIWGDTLQPGETIIIGGPFYLAASNVLFASSDANTAVTVTAEVLEFKTQPSGLTLKIINGVLLTGSAATLYTVPASGVRQALVMGVHLFNSHTGDLTPTIHRVKSGGSVGSSTIVFSGAMFTKETVNFAGPFTLGPNDFISGLASTTNLISARLAVVEAA